MSEPPVIRVSDHRRAINRILAYYGLAPETLEVVPNVFDWCQANGIAEKNLGRMAKCLCDWEKSECRIVMSEAFSQRAFDSANFTMELRGFVDEVRKLNSPRRNLLHLLLHEIACHTLRTTEQAPRDSWAFAEMVKHDI
jgi:hypothetical protein